MKFFSTVIEQLDRAIDELASDDAIDSRIALILIDNAIELLIHKTCEHYARRGTPDGDLSTGLRREAMGTNLDAKFTLLRRVGDLSEQQMRVIAICHGYRNELYHVGVRHDAILRPLAREYLRLACTLLPKLGPRSIGWGPKLKLGPRTLRYVGEDYRTGSIFHDREPIAQAILERMPDDPVALPIHLKHDLLERIDRVEEHFNYIARGLDMQAEPADTLRELQFTFDQNQILRAKKGPDAWVPWDHPGIQPLRRRLEKDWRQRHRRLPIAKWRNKANQIGNSENPLEATIMHAELHRQIDYLDEAITEALYEFDGVVQAQVDRMRGK